MRKNEQGFTYPLTLVVLILFLSIFSFRVDLLLTERKQAHETATILQGEYYFHSTVKKIEETLQSGRVIQAKGSFSFHNGIIEYQADPPISSLQKINFTLRMHSGEMLIGRGFFDTNVNKMIKWTELN